MSNYRVSVHRPNLPIFQNSSTTMNFHNRRSSNQTYEKFESLLLRSTGQYCTILVLGTPTDRMSPFDPRHDIQHEGGYV